jgi:hypothetical protein
MAISRIERILILAKTYSSPSAQYVETSCVAGITDKGCMRRLYPVPFRLIENNQQFKKWQWVDVRVEKANNDRRPESHKIYVDTLACGQWIDTRHQWAERRGWVSKAPCFDSFAAMDVARSEDGLSLRCYARRESLAWRSLRLGTLTGLSKSGESSPGNRWSFFRKPKRVVK